MKSVVEAADVEYFHGRARRRKQISKTHKMTGGLLKLRIVLADDHPFVLLGMKALFAGDDGMEVVGEANNASTLLSELAIKPCDVLVTDFAMPEPGVDANDGLLLIRKVRQDFADISIVVLTSVSNVAILRSILNAGATSLVNKAEPIELVATAVRHASVGRRFVSASFSAALAEAGTETDFSSEEPRLSPREIEVVRLFAKGHSITEIAKELDRDVRTISRQKRDAMNKLGVRNDPGLFAFVRARGLG
ncbi:response regulator [Caballeronia sp. NK8]|uniref:response regulator transcription factor n=1 Tax=Caballeronia sp. NK8 TaxID=140098 RepID=UPI001BB6F8C9|nr:response regulator transcription factor [Caballeronia sp. NK8]BCQ22156.1 response regulator [Caballeronia sp. NK8]